MYVYTGFENRQRKDLLMRVRGFEITLHLSRRVDVKKKFVILGNSMFFDANLAVNSPVLCR